MKFYFGIIFSIVLWGKINAQLYFPENTGAWATTAPSSLGWDVSRVDELKTFLTNNDSKSFIVLKDGKIVMEYYFNGHDETKTWYWASAGKSLTSTLVGIAQSEGKIDLNKSSNTYLGKGWSSCTAQQEDSIKVWNHITMTTGLDDRESFDCTDKECLKYLAAPGKRWSYHNGPYTLIDGIIEGATGQNLNLYFKQKIGDKIGMSGLFAKSGYNNVFYSTTRNMARFGLLTLANGKWGTTQVINNPTYIADMKKTSQALNPAYGYLWWLNGKDKYMFPGSQIQFPGKLIPSAPSSMYAALGKNEQRVYIIPDQNIVVIRMGDAAKGGGGNVSIAFDNELWKILTPIMKLSVSTKDQYEVSKDKIVHYFNKTLKVKSEINVESVDVYDRIGRVINVQFDEDGSDVSFLDRGIYFVRVIDRNRKVYVNRILIL
jgi:CubicO group peptidase (beta-lactamase class C family)